MIEQLDSCPETSFKLFKTPRFSRRGFLGTIGLGGLALVLSGCPDRDDQAADRRPGVGAAPAPAEDLALRPTAGQYALPQLPYGYAALEPHIDAETMEIHHSRHHQTYVNNLNAALQGHQDLHQQNLVELLHGIDDVPDNIRDTVRNNGGGHLNHTLFWQMMSPAGGGLPVGRLAQDINETFGGFPNFQNQMNQAGLGRFGSGWAWLVRTGDGGLEVVNTLNQDSPYMDGNTPLLGVDVWEHAYYLQYRNERARYLEAWWNTVDWNVVSQRYEQVHTQDAPQGEPAAT